MATKFGIPFSGAADEEIGGQAEARKGNPFPKDQADESRTGPLMKPFETDRSCGAVKMQSTAKPDEGFSGWKKMETW